MDLEVGTAEIFGDLRTPGTFTVSNSSILTVYNNLHSGPFVLGSTSNGSQASLVIKDDSLFSGPLTVSAPNTTDPASITQNGGRVQTTGNVTLAASRTTGVVAVTVAPSAVGGPMWHVGGDLIVGQNGGQARLDLDAAIATAVDGQVGFGVDSATGTPAGGTILIHNNSSLTYSGSLGLAVNVGGRGGSALVQVGPNFGALSVGGPLTLGGNATLDIEGGIVHAETLNNGGGAVKGYGIIQLNSRAGSANGVKLGQYPISPISDAPDYLRGYGTVLAPAVDREMDAGFGTPDTNGVAYRNETLVAPSGVLKTTGIAFQGHRAVFQETIGGASPTPAAAGYGQLDEATTAPIDLGDPTAADASHLGNATLAAHLANGFTPTPGEPFTIIRNESNAPYRGYFSFLNPGTGASTAEPPAAYTPMPEGSHFSIDGTTFTITYQGRPGGHDVLLIANRAPTADAGGPYTVAEGGFVRLSAGASTDPEQPSANLTYRWDLNGDGIFGDVTPAATNGREVGQQVTFAAAGLDGPGTYTVKVRVTDADGLSSEASAVVTVTNAPPTALFHADSNVPEGSSTIVDFQNPSDPSAADTAAGFTYSYD